MASESYNPISEYEPVGRLLYDYKSVVNAMHRYSLPHDDLLSMGYIVEDWGVSLPSWENIEDLRKLSVDTINSIDEAEIAARALINQAEQILLKSYWEQVIYSIERASQIIDSRPNQLFVKDQGGDVLPIESISYIEDTKRGSIRIIKGDNRIINSNITRLLIDVSSMPIEEQASVNQYISDLEISPVII
jgi:hypothetical protein